MKQVFIETDANVNQKIMLNEKEAHHLFDVLRTSDKETIRDAISHEFGYNLGMSVNEIRDRYSWSGLDGAGDGGTCQGSVPQAIVCALEANSLEDAIRNAVSIGGDSDTIACIAGSIAEALYGVPQAIRNQALSYLPEKFKVLMNRFEERFGITTVP